tara:strand:+ start:5055 stop:6182 length:1128 start_codon:yes stop_codon:yes gene_type:complete
MDKSICIVTTNLTSLNVFLKEIIIKLAKKYKITIISKNSNDKLIINKNIKYKFIPIRRKISLLNDSICLFYLTFYFIFNYFDMYISLTPKAGLLSSIAGFISNIKVRIHYYTGQVWITKKGLYRIFLILMDKLIFHLNTYNLVDSKGQFEFLLKQRIIDENKSKVIANGSISGIDTKKYKYSLNKRNKLRQSLAIKEDDIVILFVGRFVKDKGIYDLLDNFNDIRNRYSNCILVLIGSDEESIIENLRKKFFEFKNIICLDWKNNIEDWYSISDVFCLPSYREGFGLSLLEAASSSIPCVCSNIYGLKDTLIDKKTGYFFDLQNLGDLQKKLILLIENKETREKFGSNGRKYVLKNFDKDFVIKEFIEFVDLQLK